MRCVSLARSLAAAVFCAASSAWAQAADPAAAPLAAPPPAVKTTQAAGVVIPAGSPVILELVAAVSSRTVKQGDMFPMRLAAPITLDGRVIVPAGALGEGQVVDAGRSGALGKPAKLVLAARYVTVADARAPLRAFRIGAAGRDNSDAIMVASFVPYVGLLAVFAKGGEIDVPAGTLGQAKLAADLPAPAVEPAPPASSPQPISSQ